MVLFVGINSIYNVFFLKNIAQFFYKYKNRVHFSLKFNKENVWQSTGYQEQETNNKKSILFYISNLWVGIRLFWCLVGSGLLVGAFSYRCILITRNMSSCCSPSFSPMATIVLLCLAMLASIRFMPTVIDEIWVPLYRRHKPTVWSVEPVMTRSLFEMEADVT